MNAAIRAECQRVVYPLALKAFLKKHGLTFLESGLDDLPPGDALLTIAKRAGVRGLTHKDYIAETLPMVAEIAYLRCVR